MDNIFEVLKYSGFEAKLTAIDEDGYEHRIDFNSTTSKGAMYFRDGIMTLIVIDNENK